MTKKPTRSNPAAKALEAAARPAEIVGATIERALDPLASAIKRAVFTASVSPSGWADSRAKATGTNAPSKASPRASNSPRSLAGSVGMKPQSPSSVPA